MDMDQSTISKLRGYAKALRALQRSVERAINTDMVEGIGEMAVRSYQGLQGKIAELVPDDFYITDSLRLEAKEDEDDEEALGRLQFATTQLAVYLDGMIREAGERSGASGKGWSFSWQGAGTPPDMDDQPVPPVPPIPPVPPVPPMYEGGDLRGLGRDIQDQIINLTRSTLRRALNNMDINWNMRGTDLRGQNLSRYSYSGMRVQSVNWSDANLSAANFSGSNIHDCDLSRATVSRANFSGSRLENINLTGANADAANFSGAKLVNCNFTEANLTSANLSGAKMVNPELKGARLPNGAIYQSDDDLKRFGATLVRRHVHIDINFGDDEKPKRGDVDDNVGDFPSDPPTSV